MNLITPSAGASKPFARGGSAAKARLQCFARGSLAGRAALALIGLSGSLLVAFATRWGPWAFSDGAGYLMLARNLLHGRGLGLWRASGEFQPLSLHPPLFPLTLAAVGLAGADLIQIARWLNAALFGITIVFAGALVYRAAGRWWLAACASLSVLAAPLLVYLFSGAMSEPLFFALALGTLLALQEYARRAERNRLVVAGITTGLAILTRYPGVALLAPGLVAVLGSAPKGWKQRAIDGALYLGVASAPVLAWLGWVNAQPGADPPRQWTWDLSGLPSRIRPVIEGVGQALWDWLPFTSWAAGLPTWVKQGVLALLGMVVVGLTGFAVLRLRRGLPGAWRRDPSIQLIALLGAFILGYLGQLTVTYLFTAPVLDPSDIDQRILAPVLLIGGLMLFALAELLIKSAPARRWVAYVPAGVALVYAGWFLPQGWNIASGLNQAGGGYTSRSWQSSPTIAALRSLPADTPVITNESAGVMLWLDRPAYDLPLRSEGEPDSALDRFGDGPGELDQVFREDGAALVVFNSISAQLAQRYGEQAAGARLAELTQGLELFARLDDGEVFFYPIAGESE